MSLMLTRKVGEEITIADVINVKVENIVGKQVLIAVDAPSAVNIDRAEVHKRKRLHELNAVRRVTLQPES